MSQPISPQHPAVVLRSHYMQLRALLAVAMIAVVGLTVAVAILADQHRHEQHRERGTACAGKRPSGT